MESSQNAFSYTPAQIEHLKTALSLDRFSTYVAIANGNELLAIRRYEHNTALSEALYGVLQGFEIVLRNSMHTTMASETGYADWYDHVGLEARELETVAKAETKISAKN